MPSEENKVLNSKSEILNKSKIQNSKIFKLIEEFKFDEALKEIWIQVRAGNNYIEQNKPWELAKSDPKKLHDIFKKLFEMLHAISCMLHVFLPDTSAKIEFQLETLNAEPLFPRIQ